MIIGWLQQQCLYVSLLGKWVSQDCTTISALLSINQTFWAQANWILVKQCSLEDRALASNRSRRLQSPLKHYFLVDVMGFEILYYSLYLVIFSKMIIVKATWCHCPHKETNTNFQVFKSNPTFKLVTRTPNSEPRGWFKFFHFFHFFNFDLEECFRGCLNISNIFWGVWIWIFLLWYKSNTVLCGVWSRVKGPILGLLLLLSVLCVKMCKAKDD